MKPKKSKKYKSLSDYSKSSSNGIFEEFQLQAQKYKTKFILYINCHILILLSYH